MKMVSDITVGMYALAVIAVCQVVMAGRAFGFWRWGRAKWIGFASEARALGRWIVAWLVDPAPIGDEPTWRDYYEVEKADPMAPVDAGTWTDVDGTRLAPKPTGTRRKRRPKKEE